LHSNAVVIGVPDSPQEIVEKADFIALGNIVKNSSKEFLFKVVKVIKGSSGTKGKLLPFMRNTTEAMSLTYIYQLIDGKSTVFVGSMDDKNILIPKYAFCSFWPQGIEKSPHYPIFKGMSIEAVRLMSEKLIKATAETKNSLTP